jgi:hypothetical protein
MAAGGATDLSPAQIANAKELGLIPVKAPGFHETSLLKTLAGKHHSTVTKMVRTYKATIETPDGPRACLQVTVERDGGRKPLVARFGGIPIRRQHTAVLTDISPVMASTRRNELIHRPLTEYCGLCEARVRLAVHHIRKLADLNQPGRRERPATQRADSMQKNGR